MLPEHATGPTVDGVNGGFIHPLRGLFQARCIVAVVFIAQRCLKVPQKIICVLDLTSEKLRRLRQTCSDAISQLSRRCIGKGHDQYLRRHQALALPALSQN